jgi:thiamine-phosphate diphosphorylase
VNTHSLICLVTDRHRLSPHADRTQALDRIVQLAAAAAHAGVDLIQIRENDLTVRDLARLVELCVAMAEGTPSKIVVNDRLDVAIAEGAGGVHLRSDSIEAGSVRCLISGEFVVGRSAHGAAEAAEVARRGGVDYLILGTIFSTASKPPAHPVAGVEELARATAAVSVPVLAIGGVSVERAGMVAKAGAHGIAAVGLFIPPAGSSFDSHVERTVENLRQAFDTCGAVP